MKIKYLFVLLALVVILTSGCIQKESAEWDESRLDLLAFQEFNKSHFGFMHPERAYFFMKELGVHWARPHPGPFIWGRIEKTKGLYDWSEADSYMKRSQANDVVIIATIWPYADWDQEKCHAKLPPSSENYFIELGDYRGKPCDMEQYKEFLKKLVERYDGDGKDDMPGLKYPIKYWEIINEAELSPRDSERLPFFNAETDHDYFDVLKTSYITIKEVDPEAKVLVGGIAGEFRDESAEPLGNFMDKGGKNYTDILNIHTDFSPENLHLKTVREFMENHGIDMPIWITELQFGASEGHPLFEPEGFMTNATEEEVAEHLVKIFVQAFAAGATRIFYVGLDDSPSLEKAWLVNCEIPRKEGPLEMIEKALKLLKDATNETCTVQKPYYVFRTMIDKIDKFTEVETLFASEVEDPDSQKYCGDGVCDGPETPETCPEDCKNISVSETAVDGEAYKFIVNGKAVYVVWGQKLPKEITGQVKVTDIFGNEKIMNASEIKLSESPVFIETEKEQIGEKKSEQQPEIAEYQPPEPIVVTDKKEPLVYLGGMNFYTFNYASAPTGKDVSGFYQDKRKFISAMATSAQLCERNSALGEKYGIVWGRNAPGFRRDVIEPEIGIYNFNLSDVWMQAASNHGINFVGTLDFYERLDWPDYEGTLRPFGTEPPIPEDMEAYKKLVEALVERYDNDGINDMPGLEIGIKYWEAGNEAGYLSGEDQLAITKATYEAVKRVCPSCKLLNGAATDGDIFKCIDRSDDCEWVEFFRLGGGQYIDVFSLHWGMERERPNFPDDRFQFVNMISHMKRIINNYAGKEIPIWLTEFEVPKDVNDIERKSWIVKRMTQGIAHGVEKFFPGFIKDNIGGEESLQFMFDSVTEEPRDFYYIFVSLEEKIKGFNSVEKISDTKYKFIFTNRSVYVLWDEGGDENIPAEISGTVKLVDLVNGDESYVDASNIILTSEPIIIEVV